MFAVATHISLSVMLIISNSGDDALLCEGHTPATTTTTAKATVSAQCMRRGERGASFRRDMWAELKTKALNTQRKTRGERGRKKRKRNDKRRELILHSIVENLSSQRQKEKKRRASERKSEKRGREAHMCKERAQAKGPVSGRKREWERVRLAKSE